jgi:hypothetical protein
MVLIEDYRFMRRRRIVRRMLNLDLRSILAEMRMGSLYDIRETARTRGEAAFLEELEDIDRSGFRERDYEAIVNHALQAGAFVAAERLVAEGYHCYPEGQRLRHLFEVLRPPVVRSTEAPAEDREAVRAANDWLFEHGADYVGKWVALRAGQLVASAATHEELLDAVDDPAGLFLTRVA